MDDSFLAHVLQRAENDRTGRDRFRTSDFERYVPDEVEACLHAGLLVDGEPALSAACPACLECGELEVEWEEGGATRRSAFVFCPEYGKASVQKEALRQWRFSLKGLAHHLAA